MNSGFLVLTAGDKPYKGVISKIKKLNSIFLLLTAGDKSYKGSKRYKHSAGDKQSVALLYITREVPWLMAAGEELFDSRRINSRRETCILLIFNKDMYYGI